MDKSSLLPKNLGDLERDLDVAISRMENIKIPISTLWDPWNCPIELLPWLAWAVSVDDWRTDWPETTKRRVVANSLDMHRVKGTRPAVEMSVESLGLEYELIEWFEEIPKGQPATFSLKVFSSDQAFPPERISEIERIVSNAKNTRSHFKSLNITLKSRANLQSNLACQNGEVTTVYPYRITQRTINSLMKANLSFSSYELISIYPRGNAGLDPDIIQDISERINKAMKATYVRLL